MDGVNINKYFGQFNPILIVPVLSAVIGAILVFVFGFRKTHGPKFSTSSNTDSLKRSKKKSTTTKPSGIQQSSKVQNAQSAKVNKKEVPVETVVTKPIAKKKEEKKTEEKRPENASPTKKAASVAKKTTAQEISPTTAATSKKQKSNKKQLAAELGEKPADFDDGNWFTVQSKSTKKKDKSEETVVKSADGASASPPPTAPKSKSAEGKTDKIVEKKPAEPITVAVESIVAVESVVAATPAKVEPAVIEKTAAVETVAPAAPADVVEEEIVVVAKPEPVVAPVPTPQNIVADVVEVEDQSNVAFDELGEWTDAKPDRKKGKDKKKSRKD